MQLNSKVTCYLYACLTSLQGHGSPVMESRPCWGAVCRESGTSLGCFSWGSSRVHHSPPPSHSHILPQSPPHHCHIWLSEARWSSPWSPGPWNWGRCWSVVVSMGRTCCCSSCLQTWPWSVREKWWWRGAGKHISDTHVEGLWEDI